MAERKVIWTATSSKQLREVFSYWNRRNKSSAFSKKLLNVIKQDLRRVQAYPESFPVTVTAEIRVSAIGHYSIFYFFDDNAIVVVSFWDNRQDPEKLLSILKKGSQSDSF